MRFSALVVAVCATALTADAFAPVSCTQKRTSTKFSMSQNEAHETKSSNWWGPATATLVGWSMAAQLATASIVPLPLVDVVQQGSIMSAQPTTLVAGFGGAETMDFSLPSYGEATKGDVKAKGAGNVPSFNPFGDFKPEIVSQKESATSEPAAVMEEKVAVETKKADDKAAKAATKAAADAEIKAAAEAKKAQKEARLKAEKEKQKAAQERAKNDAAPATKAPEVSSFKAPEIPAFKAPDIKAPDISIPSIPDFKTPDIKMPSMPDFKAPDMSKMSFSVPKFDMPKIEAPTGGYDLDIPKMPKNLPKVEMPKNMPAMPKISNSFAGSVTTDVGAPMADQDTRDERARGARGTFLAADQDAKALEQQARDLREVANGKKKLASLAKDEACKTRPGGKFLCLRNPFGSGF